MLTVTTPKPRWIKKQRFVKNAAWIIVYDEKEINLSYILNSAFMIWGTIIYASSIYNTIKKIFFIK